MSQVPAAPAAPEETVRPAPPSQVAAVDPNQTEAYAGTLSPGWKNGLPLTLPATLGRYRLNKLLGKGGMGAVYLAQDTQLQRQVAVKIPLFHGANAEQMRERFLREARAAAALSHPNLCPVYDVGESHGLHYLTMAYIEGRSLATFIRQGQILPERQVALVIRQLALALFEAHERGIIHRDLKPANVIITPKKQPVIMDFGLARIGPDKEAVRLTQDGTIMGTPAYMPPEQVNGDVQAMGPGCDIYSLGVMMYELLTGHLPFEGPLGTLMAKIIQDAPPPLRQYRPQINSRREEICLKALSKQVAGRFLTMKEFAAALTNYLEKPSQSSSVTVNPTRNAEAASVFQLFKEMSEATESKPPPLPRRSRSGGWLVFAILIASLAMVVLMVVAGGAVWWFMSSWEEQRQAGLTPAPEPLKEIDPGPKRPSRPFVRPTEPIPTERWGKPVPPATATGPKPNATASKPVLPAATMPSPNPAPPVPPPPTMPAELTWTLGQCRELPWSGAHIRRVAFSPDQKYLAASSDYNTVGVWDFETSPFNMSLLPRTP
jgi:serine/threonine protein kinase